MALLETLRSRAARLGGTARVDCGDLGVLTVEALSPADAARLADDPRALVYTACRDLQQAGESLRSEGRLFRPDEIMACLTDGEAALAARTVADISGLSEFRLPPVQLSEGDFSEIRLDSVQAPLPIGADSGADSGQTGEIRLSSVQSGGEVLSGNGQVSRETAGGFLEASAQLSGDFAPDGGSDRKSQAIGEMSSRGTQIVVPKSDEVLQGVVWVGRRAGDLHETESEFGRQNVSDLHEIESEIRKTERGHLHEIESEFGGSGWPKLHETMSEFGRGGRLGLHETMSESEALLHEMKSELRKAVHEIKSELAKTLHETESELAEAAARHMAEALRQAGQVR